MQVVTNAPKFSDTTPNLFEKCSRSSFIFHFVNNDKNRRTTLCCVYYLFIISKNTFIVVQQPGMLEEISKKSDTDVCCSPKGLDHDKT
mmetsp:Transcript_9115/g.14055  ORF Transcript_9115/g.14055 Transcript_9115/m.14055 type:complete len:88 (-) Transcript_9115:118-381(-)